MEDQHDSNEISALNFTLTPDRSSAHIDLSQGNFIEFKITAKNCSRHLVSVHPLLIPGRSQVDETGQAGSLEDWKRWLSLPDSDPVMYIDAFHVSDFLVRIEVPTTAPLGVYEFRFALSGVNDPDRQIVVSDPITFTVNGPKTSVRSLAIGSLVLMLLVITGVIAAALFANQPSLKARLLEAPEQVTAGEMITYRLKIQNSGSGEARNVMLEYFPTETIVEASASIIGEAPRRCDAVRLTENHPRSLRCDLGTLRRQDPVEVMISALPGPVSEETVLSEDNRFTVTGQLGESDKNTIVQVAGRNPGVKVVPAVEQAYAVALVPNITFAQVGEEIQYQVLAWSTGIGEQDVLLTFQLPSGMRYTSDLPNGCGTTENYYQIRCDAALSYASTSAGIQRFVFKATAARAGSYVSSLKASLKGDEKQVERSAEIRAANTALYFNGAGDWVELGYRQALPSFTFEAWVHPYSTEDGQSFAGLHNQETDGAVNNLFLVGYWFGSLHVNVAGEAHNLVTPKGTDRFHLAVVVEAVGERSKVQVYVDGVEQLWEQDATPAELAELPEEDRLDCLHCKVFQKTIPEGDETLGWVLGQDRDTGRASDFFHGTLSEVRIWNTARTQDQILETRQARPRGDEADLAAYYRLEPGVEAGDTLPSKTAGALPGTRRGASWAEAAPLYGSALHFNGINQSLAVPELKFSNLAVSKTGYVDLTLAGWFRVDEIPTRQEWLLGSTGPRETGITGRPASGSQVEMIRQILSEEETALAEASSQLKAARSESEEQKQETAQAKDANSIDPRDQLFYSLYVLSQRPSFSQKLDARVLEAAKMFDVDPLLAVLSDTELQQLAQGTGDAEVKALATAVRENIARYKIFKDSFNAAPSPAAAAQGNVKRLCEVSYGFLGIVSVGACFRVDVNPVDSGQTVVVYDPAVTNKQLLAYLMAEERGRYYANLQALYQAMGQETMPASIKANQSKLLGTAPAVIKWQKTISTFPPYAAMRALAVLHFAELVQGDSKRAFSSMQSASSDLQAAVRSLRPWLYEERKPYINSSTAVPGQDQYILTLDLAINYLEKYQAVLDKTQAEQNGLTAATEQESYAQERLKSAQLAGELVGKPADAEQYRELLSLLEAHRARESALVTVSALVEEAAGEAASAAFEAAQENQLSSWIGPYLDSKLGESTYRLAAEESIYPAALKAAQAAFTKGSSGNTGTPQLEEMLNKLAAEAGVSPDRSITAQVNAYLDTLGKGAATERIPNLLVDPLAESVARQAAAEIVQRLALTGLPEALKEQARAAVQGRAAQALEYSRWQVRLTLFSNTGRVVNQMEQELAGKGINDYERQVKIGLRGILVDTNRALFPLLSETTAFSVESSNERTAEMLKTVTSAAEKLELFLNIVEKQGRSTGLEPGANTGADLAAASSGIAPPDLWAGLLVDEDGRVMLAVRTAYSGEWTLLKDEKAVHPEEWVHYAAVVRYDPLTDTVVGGESKPVLYRDGSPVKGYVGKAPSLPDITELKCPAGFYIGGLCDPLGNYAFAGTIDEVRLWNRPLAEEDIQLWRAMPRTAFDEQAYWSFDDGPGSTTQYLTPAGFKPLALHGPGWVISNIGQEVTH